MPITKKILFIINIF